ncbi:MAG TPA: hypothetical protein DCP11_12495, partial [Microbacteriaceae bacterium]|nr:hypothetical protein [Microbacteriaceae bacterium]
AATGSNFSPGNIISDAVFYNSNAMTSAQIQGFIDSKEVCVAGYTCLENFRQTTVSRAADAKCDAYTGVQSQLASDIIYSVARACGLNPQVLLTLLEKEQGLVTSNSPSAARFNIATGYACPDTAPCDAQYYGFYNQVYKAAWQYETYRLFPTSFSYRAGRSNNILWNPNSACGASAVYIENQATAGLYIYTPYQPNAAALNNLYGIGDGCSSYGNRNFWRIFSDWFGNPQGGGWFAKTSSDSTIYLLTSNHKYPVPSGEILNAYWALGPYRTVSADYLSQFTTGIPLGQLVRDPTTGEIFYSDLGVKHHVATCAQLVDYATSCSNYIDLTPTQILTLSTGADLTSFARSAATGAIYYVSAGKKSWIHSMSDVLRLNNGATPNFINLGPTALASIPDGPDYVAAGSLIKVADQQTVYLVDGLTRLVPVPSTSLASDFTSDQILTVSPSTLGAFAIASGTLTSAVTCASATYVAGGGQLWQLTANSSGLPATALDTTTCAALQKSAQSVPGALFLRSPATGAIYLASGGKKNHLSTMTAVYDLNGGTSPTLVPMGEDSLNGIASGRELLGPTQLVKTAANSMVYMIDGLATKIPIDLFETASEFGINGYSVVADETLNEYTAAPANLSIVVTCGAAYFVAGGGQLWSLSGGSSYGLTTTAIDPLTCASIRKSPQSISGALFLRSPSTGAVYLVANGKKNYMTSMTAVYDANGGTQPVFVPVSEPVLARIPS